MNLVIDRGNSSTKIAVFDQHRLVYQAVLDVCEPSALTSVIATYSVQQIIYSSVVTTEQFLSDFLTNNAVRFIDLTNSTPVPIKIIYETPLTLGRDGIAALVSAWSL